MPLDSFHTQLDLILPPLRQRLMDVTGFPQERVLFIQGDVTFHTQAEQYLVVKLEDEKDEEPIILGAGRHDVRELQVFSVTVRTRCSLDQAQESFIQLTDLTLGHLRIVHQVKDAMILFQPLDPVTGKWLVTEPILPQRGSRPESLPQEPEWMQKTLWFTLKYELNLSLDYQ
jgi:hypothetical protein